MYFFNEAQIKHIHIILTHTVLRSYKHSKSKTYNLQFTAGIWLSLRTENTSALTWPRNEMLKVRPMPTESLIFYTLSLFVLVDHSNLVPSKCSLFEQTAMLIHVF